jgi:UDP-GlcNAc:undecaprenyl-phosphate GlcNAc-1-phosphate transferase
MAGSLLMMVLFTISTAMATIVLYVIILQWIARYQCYRLNYRNHKIPTGVGILIPLVNVLLIPLVFAIGDIQLYVIQSILLLFITYIGWRDDVWGNHAVKGLRGHLRHWIENGEWSSAMTKALAGSIIAFLVSYGVSTSFSEFLLNFLILTLSTNLINLLDLRPGRAIKGFFIYFLAIVFTTSTFPSLLWLPVFIPVLFLFIVDLRERAMLGDAGANCLGLALGWWTVLVVPLGARWGILMLLILIQVYAEKKSITSLIRQVAFLHWVDMLGRKSKT